tara:strand:- start:715 stop:2868 length:2154 start_codon:yes stop_codon:yes gene_type:complete
MSFNSKNPKNKNIKGKEGFAIPQILILGIGVAVGISGLMAASILGLTGSRINRQELLAKSSSYSGITRLRTLFNDKTKGRLFNYFWLVNNCSEKADNCNVTNISLPPSEYWEDIDWCNNEENCQGRQKAPFCPPDLNYSWEDEKEIVSNLFSNNNYIGNTRNNLKKDFNQSFNIISTKYIGGENNGTNSILIDGFSTPKNSNLTSASNKLRVNIQINSETSSFGFISSGENNSDKTDSLFLGSLRVLKDNNYEGSIIWRMNLDNFENCRNFKSLAKGENADLPESTNNGIWIQPIGMPKQPKLKNVIDIGTVICNEYNQNQNTNCKLNSGNLPVKTFRIYSLISRGPGSVFEISTKDDGKIILEILGDIDISNEGMICHRNGTEKCGTGKPENLTILFKQKNSPIDTKLVCNRDSYEGGIKIKNNNSFNNIDLPFNNNLLPGSSFFIDNTAKAYGRNYDEKFGAFIYGPKTTFFTTTAKSQWIQKTNPNLKNNNKGLIFTSRGTFGYIKNVYGNNIKDKMINLILDSDKRLINYGGYQDISNVSDIEIIAIGKKVINLPENSTFDKNANDVFLIFDKINNTYHIRSFSNIDINPINNSNYQYSYPASFAILNPKNSENNIELGTSQELSENIEVDEWLEVFDIDLHQREANFLQNFSGSVWVKNFCLDNDGIKTWEFSKNYVDEIKSWHGSEFNWGIKSYRGQSITLWDTLREFKFK